MIDARQPRRPADEIAALFAATRVLARRLADPRLAGTVDRRRLTLLARGLVRAAEANDPAFLGLVALAEVQRDPPGRTAILALLAIGTAREITTSRRALSRLALTVLVADLGLHAPEAAGGPREVPAATAAATIEKLGADPTALLVADASAQAAWLDRERALGPVDGGELGPHVIARVLHGVRAFLDRVAPADGSPARPPLEALLEVGALPSIDPAVYRCLVRALGSTPAGSLVELTTGEWAVVLPPASAQDPHDRPRVRLLTDAEGRARANPIDVDLADGAEGRRIVRLLDPALASASVAAAFLS
jgi:hypothetical protein